MHPANKCDYFVTSLGEQYRKDKYISEVSTIGPDDLAADQAFAARYRKHLTTKERRVLSLIFRRQDLVDDGRFRVYGGIYRGKPEIVLVTEVCYFCHDHAFWAQVDQVAAQTKAEQWTMREEPHVDKRSEDGGRTWQTGAGHGQMERQVELSWRIENLNKRQFIKLLTDVTAATDEVYDKAGVSVC